MQRWKGGGGQLFDIGSHDRYARDLGNVRIAYVAAETGARFVRDRIQSEPIDWLLSSHQLFDGKNALTACRTEEGFRRAVVLHGLAASLDASPGSLAGMRTEDFLGPTVRSFLADGRGPGHDWDRAPRGSVELYTSSISAHCSGDQIHLFCAMLARHPDEVRARLRRRHGPVIEDVALIRRGFDWSEPIACAMVSDAIGEMLMLVDADPGPWLAQGLDFHVEQRFSA